MSEDLSAILTPPEVLELRVPRRGEFEYSLPEECPTTHLLVATYTAMGLPLELVAGALRLSVEKVQRILSHPPVQAQLELERTGVLRHVLDDAKTLMEAKTLLISAIQEKVSDPRTSLSQVAGALKVVSDRLQEVHGAVEAAARGAGGAAGRSITGVRRQFMKRAAELGNAGAAEIIDAVGEEVPSGAC